MDNLDLVIGFSTIMLVFAQVVTKVVDAIIVAFNKRALEYESLVDQIVSKVETISADLSEGKDKVIAVTEEVLGFDKEEVNTPLLVESVAGCIDGFDAGHKARLEAALDQLERQATVGFRKYCRNIALPISILMALIFSIDSITVFKELSVNAETRQAVLQAEIEIVKLKEMNEASYDIDFDSYTEQLNQLKETGLPIGWSTSPFFGDSPSSLEIIWWLIGCLITGVLAGLGAPFWRQLLSNANKARTLAGSKRSTIS